MFDEKGRLVVSIGEAKAADVSIADAGGLITATNVEDALQEIFADYQAGGVSRTLGGDLDANNHSINNVLIPRHIEVNLPAGSWNYPTTNPAPLERDVGTNGGMFVHAFDDTTEEFIILEPAFRVPANLDTTGTIYLKAEGYAKTADGNEIQLRFHYSSRAKGESWDSAYSTVDSGDYSCYGTQDYLDEVEWSMAASNLTAGDLLRIMLSRIAINDGTGLSGDWLFANLCIRIPVT